MVFFRFHVFLFLFCRRRRPKQDDSWSGPRPVAWEWLLATSAWPRALWRSGSSSSRGNAPCLTGRRPPFWLRFGMVSLGFQQVLASFGLFWTGFGLGLDSTLGSNTRSTAHSPPGGPCGGRWITWPHLLLPSAEGRPQAPQRFWTWSTAGP